MDESGAVKRREEARNDEAAARAARPHKLDAFVGFNKSLILLIDS